MGSYPDAPEGLGLSDTAGNVWEWCNDLWVCNLGTAPVTDPTGPTGGSLRVQRGASWNWPGDYLRCAARSNADQGVSYFVYGLRVAGTVNP